MVNMLQTRYILALHTAVNKKQNEWREHFCMDGQLCVKGEARSIPAPEKQSLPACLLSKKEKKGEEEEISHSFNYFSIRHCILL